MEMTELDKLIRDRCEMLMVRRKMEEARDALSMGRRITACWLRNRLTLYIAEIDDRIEKKNKEIRKEQEAGSDGQGQSHRDETADRADQVDDHVRGRGEEGLQRECERAGAEGGAAGQLGDVEPVPDVAAEEGTGGRNYARAGGTAEECLRRRYQERNGLRDWQEVIMEADRRGKHERLVL